MIFVRFVLRIFFIAVFAYGFITLALHGPDGFVQGLPTTWQTIQSELLPAAETAPSPN